ncbi:MAG: DmsC/YnfH family molybdoenzyme membrane anchor subunit [Planctomycetaceae bacterium]
MSIALPVLPNSERFIADLLREQHSLTAVERFSELPASSEHVQSRYYRALLPSSPPRTGHRYAFEVDLDKCSGCKACVVACHSMNGLEDDEVWRRVGITTTNEPLGRIQYVTTACHHCEEPGCLQGCPVKAYIKDPNTGIVRHLDDQCIGCKYCTMMCPYEVPQYSSRLGIVRKCDMCHQRLAAGEAPACVQGCPNEAIAIREVAVEVLSDKRSERLAPGAPSSAVTRPTTIYKTAYPADYEASLPQDAGIDEVADDHWPLACMLVATQASVGLILAERCASWLGNSLGQSDTHSVTRIAVGIALGLSLAGLGIAPLHLGRPLRAWRVFLGLQTSWLSREAILLGCYVGLLTATAGIEWYSAIRPFVPNKLDDYISLLPAGTAEALLTGSLLIGVAGLISSAMVYIVTPRALWRMSRTMPRFLVTALITGAAGLLPILLSQRVSAEICLAVSAATCVLLVSKLGWEYRLYAGTGRSAEDVRSARLARGPLSALLTVRFVTGAAAVVLLLAAAVVAVAEGRSAVIMAVAAAALALGGEFAERLLYFATVVYDRMPGTLR